MPSSGTFHHIKGYQTITSESSVEARLKNYVDSLANEAITKIPVKFSLKTSIQLIGDNKTLFSTSSIVQYCQKQVSITLWQSRLGNDIFEKINWKIYNQLCLHFKNQVSIIKLINEITPTNQR